MQDRGWVRYDRAKALLVLQTCRSRTLALWDFLVIGAAYEPVTFDSPYGVVRLSAGQKLVSSRGLAKDLQHSEPTVRRGLRALESLGLIRRDALVTHPPNANRRTSLTHPPTVVTVLYLAGENADDDVTVTHPPDAEMTHPPTKSDAEVRSKEVRNKERERDISTDSAVEKIAALLGERRGRSVVTRERIAEWISLHDGDGDHVGRLLSPCADKPPAYLDRVVRDAGNRRDALKTGPRRVAGAAPYVPYLETTLEGPSAQDIRAMQVEFYDGWWLSEKRQCSVEHAAEYMEMVDAHAERHNGDVAGIPWPHEWLRQQMGGE